MVEWLEMSERCQWHFLHISLREEFEDLGVLLKAVCNLFVANRVVLDDERELERDRDWLPCATLIT